MDCMNLFMTNKNKDFNSIATSIFIVVSYVLFFTYLYINHSKLESATSFYKAIAESKEIPKTIKLIDEKGNSIYSGKVFHYCLDNESNNANNPCILFLDKSANISFNDQMLISIDNNISDNFLFKQLEHSQVLSIDSFHFIIPKNEQIDAVKEIAQFLNNQTPLNKNVEYCEEQ